MTRSAPVPRGPVVSCMTRWGTRGVHYGGPARPRVRGVAVGTHIPSVKGPDSSPSPSRDDDPRARIEIARISVRHELRERSPLDDATTRAETTRDARHFETSVFASIGLDRGREDDARTRARGDSLHHSSVNHHLGVKRVNRPNEALFASWETSGGRRRETDRFSAYRALVKRHGVVQRDGEAGGVESVVER